RRRWFRQVIRNRNRQRIIQGGDHNFAELRAFKRFADSDRPYLTVTGIKTAHPLVATTPETGTAPRARPTPKAGATPDAVVTPAPEARPTPDECAIPGQA